ncbi:hypothetical protein Sjap_008971 [Stephania japonica]|uniref:Uncharacterized protein n=1 Tax=Stephania japonica TaxID=461633 RepID=A0AAP0JSZ1_9MAGN
MYMGMVISITGLIKLPIIMTSADGMPCIDPKELWRDYIWTGWLRKNKFQ